MSRITARPFLRSGLAWTGLAGISFGILGFLASIAVQRVPFVRLLASSWEMLPYLAALASCLVGGIGWWLTVERPQRLTRSRGALVGLLTGLFAHPVMWLLLFVYQDPGTITDPLQEGGLTALILFTYYGLALTGVFTIGVGILCGLAITVARERTGTREDEERERLGVVASKYFVAGIVVLPVVLLGIVLPRPLVASVLLAASVSVVVVRRLPVVRTYLTQSYRVSSEDSVGTVTGIPFLLRHAVVTAGGGVLYFLAFLGYSSLSRSLFSGSSAPISETASLHVLFPLLFAGFSLLIALAVNYLRNRWEPSRSLRRAAFEWAAFLVPVVASYAVGIAELFGLFRI